MAVISHFEVIEAEGRLQPTQVKARVKIIRPEGNLPILQLDTYGSDDRQNTGKMSQTVQFNAERARDLYEILVRVYGF